MLLATNSSAVTLGVIGLGGTFLTALGSLGVALINTRKTIGVQKTVNGTLSALMAQVRAEHEAKLALTAEKAKVEIELAVLKDRIGREPPRSD